MMKFSMHLGFLDAFFNVMMYIKHLIDTIDSIDSIDSIGNRFKSSILANII